MDNKGKEFRLLGFINPYCVLPAFVYPVFAHSGQYYYEDGNGYRINEFISADKVLQKKQFFPIKETKYLSVGDETIYAYQTQKDCVTYGNGKMMHVFLTEEFHKTDHKLLCDEINNVIMRIIEHIYKDNQLAHIEDKAIDVAVQGINTVQKHYPKSIKAHAKIQNINTTVLVSPKSKGMAITIDPTKALANKGNVIHRNVELQHYTNLMQHYSRLLYEFYMLYEDLVKTRQPSLGQFHLYDVDFCNRFIQIVILQSGANLREEDILAIYRRLNFKNNRFGLSRDRLRNERALRLAIKKLNRETEIQMKINSLFYQMIDLSSQDPKVEIPQLDIKYLEEV